LFRRSVPSLEREREREKRESGEGGEIASDERTKEKRGRISRTREAEAFFSVVVVLRRAREVKLERARRRRQNR